jgi:hypothetical protein
MRLPSVLARGLSPSHGRRFRDGKHVSFSLVYDRLQVLEQLGLIPAPAG